MIAASLVPLALPAPVALIHGAPSWACTARASHPHVCPPRPGRAYRRFLRTTVARYRARIAVWEVWNEPNVAAFWKPRPDSRSYARLLRASYAAIKRADPTATVLFAATSYTDLPFTAAVLRRLRGARAFDAVAVHPYPDPHGPLEQVPITTEDGEQLDLDLKGELLAVQDVFERHGYGRPDLWITEIGWLADDADPDDIDPGEVSLDQQAEFLEQVYELITTDPEIAVVRVVLWYASRDGATGADAYGLLWNDFNPKPAAESFQLLATRT